MDTTKPSTRAAGPAAMESGRTVAKRSQAHLYAGFVSGLSSSVLLQPLDLLKTRVQQEHMSMTSAIRQIRSVGDLWRGTIPSAVRTSVGSALYFTTLNATRVYLARDTSSSRHSSTLPQLSMLKNLLAGGAVRGFVGFLTMPVTVIKVRYESNVHNYSSIASAIKDVYRVNGVRGFFSGFAVTFVRDAPYAGLYVLFYEKCKDILNVLTGKRTTGSSMAINSASAAVSATLATTITAPFDTIKTRVQIDPVKYPNVVVSTRLIVQQGGFKALFHGLSLRLSRKALSAGISWCVYEELIKML
uniref:Mitochondrial glycine transporter n=1 Tax=Blastobotrys adeninivorans TaxID=409370 RepID=A0A060T585_BLAAD